eukprot:m.306813 g.306813  ORF g.306813 m.306813 type:complete len:77 (+) comp16354_c0_seq4:161-391(+)
MGMTTTPNGETLQPMPTAKLSALSPSAKSLRPTSTLFDGFHSNSGREILQLSLSVLLDGSMLHLSRVCTVSKYTLW